jgi:hypothetical protein
MGEWGLSSVTVRSARSLCIVGDRPPSTSRIVGFHSVEELGFQLLDRRDVSQVKFWDSVYLRETGLLVSLAV